MLNWIVLNRTDYLHKNEFGVKQHTKVDMPQNPTNQTKPKHINLWKLCVLDSNTWYHTAECQNS